MSYKIGLVERPSVEKSGFFNATAMNDVPGGAYPFTTIDPSISEAYVRAECATPEFDESCTPSVGYCDHGMRFVLVKLVGVAGLIPGTHEGKGLGSQFLTDLNKTDVPIHVVDFSNETDIEGEATEGHDPREGIDFLEDELGMWYLGVLEKGTNRYRSGYHGKDKDIEVDLTEQISTFETNKDEIKQIILSLGLELDPGEWDGADKGSLAREIRKRTKPVIIAADKVDRLVSQKNYEEITADSDYEHLAFIPTSAYVEKVLKRADESGVVDYRPGDDNFDIVSDVSDEQKAGLEQIREFVTEFGGTDVQQLLKSVLFDVMGTIATFPGSANGKSNSQDVFRDCFILPEGSTTEDFTYRLHSDIGDGLLHGIDCCSKRQIGSDHGLLHRDVIEIIPTN